MSRLRTTILDALERTIAEEEAKLERWRKLQPDGSAAIDHLVASIQGMQTAMTIVQITGDPDAVPAAAAVRRRA